MVKYYDKYPKEIWFDCNKNDFIKFNEDENVKELNCNSVDGKIKLMKSYKRKEIFVEYNNKKTKLNVNKPQQKNVAKISYIINGIELNSTKDEVYAYECC